MAVTLGNLVDAKIRYYEKFNLTKALILDACATVIIESACDEIQEEIKKEALKTNKGITYRYSPGYGDFPIDIQKKILDILEAQKKIGLSVTEDSILIPRKSVTAVIGFQDRVL
jgi:cobalamin-dependent methionine synthase I